MVSLRRRRLLGSRLCAGSSIVSPLPQILNGGSIALGSNSPNLHPMRIDDTKQLEDKSVVRGWSVAPNASVSSTSKEHQSQPHPGQPVKRRKRHRRKQVQNQEQCLMRGVYFKNMKWQAAIKVDKKQIHLGTVGLQEEAARLYDRAAFMCGREPNFELSEEEKRELSKFKWDEFLAITRSTINSKKSKRKSIAISRKKSEPELANGDFDGKQGGQALSGSEDMEPDSSASG